MSKETGKNKIENGEKSKRIKIKSKKRLKTKIKTESKDKKTISLLIQTALEGGSC